MNDRGNIAIDGRNQDEYKKEWTEKSYRKVKQ